MIYRTVRALAALFLCAGMAPAAGVWVDGQSGLILNGGAPILTETNPAPGGFIILREGGDVITTLNPINATVSQNGLPVELEDYLRNPGAFHCVGIEFDLEGGSSQLDPTQLVWDERLFASENWLSQGLLGVAIPEPQVGFLCVLGGLLPILRRRRAT